MTAATVVVPTHDHGALLGPSLRSVQEQTVSDIEIFVVGDGVPDETRALVAELARGDGRIRFFDSPKGPRNGELHRHAALAEARGEIVCYQADDDLWLPGHLEELGRLLASADFAHSLALRVDADGSLSPWLAGIQSGAFRALMQRGANFVPLSTAGHTLAAYRRLPHGWRTTPQGTPTDLYMWRQLLDQPGIRPLSGRRPTVLNFPAPVRRDWSAEQRLAELELWSALLADAAWRDRIEPAVRARTEAAARRLQGRLRLLGPFAGAAQSRPLLGKPPRRLARWLWQRETDALESWLAAGLDYRRVLRSTSPYSLVYPTR